MNLNIHFLKCSIPKLRSNIKRASVTPRLRGENPISAFVR